MAAAGKKRSGLHWLYTIHLWVGIIVGLQLLLWTASGLFMTSNALESVRGDDLRRKPVVVDLRDAGVVLPPSAVISGPVETAELTMLLGRPVYRMKSGEARWLVDARTGQVWTLTADDAAAVARAAVSVEGDAQVTPVGDPPPRDLRRPGGAFRVAWPDGTHVYIGVAGEVLGIRTDLWRWFDFAWGLHILDPVGREDTHHPLLIASAALSLVSVISGIVLVVVYFRRRRRQARA